MHFKSELLTAVKYHKTVLFPFLTSNDERKLSLQFSSTKLELFDKSKYTTWLPLQNNQLNWMESLMPVKSAITLLDKYIIAEV